MAQEIKSIDVENDAEGKYITVFQRFGWELKSSQRVFNQDSRAVGAISYENVTYVHSETETVDFTKLVFERDTKIPNYDQLVELEEEFWELSAIVSDGKPYMPPHAETMEQWAKHFEPDLRTREEKVRLHVTFGILMVGVVFGGMTVGNIFELGALGAYGIVIGAVVLGFAWFRRNKGAKQHALKVAMKPKQTQYRTALEELYNNVTERINVYNQSVARMREILIQASDLLDT